MKVGTMLGIIRGVGLDDQFANKIDIGKPPLESVHSVLHEIHLQTCEWVGQGYPDIVGVMNDILKLSDDPQGASAAVLNDDVASRFREWSTNQARIAKKSLLAR